MRGASISGCYASAMDRRTALQAARGGRGTGDRHECDRYSEATVEVFASSLMMQPWNGGGRIRLLKSLIPLVNSRRNSCWRDLYDMSAEPDVIRASYRLTVLTNPGS